jgi:hypothetical protein
MPQTKELNTLESASENLRDEGRLWFELLRSADVDGLSLPPSLNDYQEELELLLGRVFSGRPRLPENLALALQMSLNWCAVKCRELGLTQ